MLLRPILLVAIQGVLQLCSARSITSSEQQLLGSQFILNKTPFDYITNELKKAHIIHDVVDEFTPECFVLPLYGKHPVKLGNSLKPKNTKEKPTLRIFCPSKSTTRGMTIVLTDPDAPSRKDPKWGEFCHWIAAVESTHPGELGMAFEVHSSEIDDIVEYKPPAPPAKTGAHRYVFVLLEGDNTNVTKPEDRKHWGHDTAGHGVRDWAKDEGLQVVGANFFYAENKKQ